jgi:hypothetical protein
VEFTPPGLQATSAAAAAAAKSQPAEQEQQQQRSHEDSMVILRYKRFLFDPQAKQKLRQ